MVVVADTDGGARTDVVIHIEVEEAEGAGISMALQVPAHPVVAVGETVREERALRVQEQAGRFGRRGGDDHEVGGLFLQMIVRIEVGDARHAPLRVGEDFLHHAFGAQLAVTGGERLRNHGVVRAAFGVHFAGEAHAPAAAHASAAPVVGNGVARYRRVEGVQADQFGGLPENLVLAVGRKRWHGQRLLARRFEGIVAVVAGDADLPFCFLVEGLEVLIGNGPVGERAAFRPRRRSSACGSPSPCSATPLRRS